MPSALQSAIDELHAIVGRRNPTWPASSSFYRFDPLRFGSANHGQPFVDWMPGSGEMTESQDRPGFGTGTSGSFWVDDQAVTARITARSYEDLKLVQNAVTNASVDLSGSSQDVKLFVPGPYTFINEGSVESQNSYLAIEQTFRVRANNPIVSRSQLTTVLTASFAVSSSLTADPVTVSGSFSPWVAGSIT